MINPVCNWLCRAAFVGAVSIGLSTVSAGFAQADDQMAAVGDQQRINLEAVIANGAKTLKDKISFTVSRFENGGVGPIVATAEKSPAELSLPAGQYRVSTVYGDVTVDSNLEVASSAVKHRVNLNAGWVRLKVIPHRGAKPMKGDVSWEVMTYGRDANGKRHRVATANGPRPSLVLPEGFYLVRAKTRDARVKHTIEVTAGHTYKYTLNMNAGSLHTSALTHDGGLFASDEVTWEVYRKGGKRVLSSITGATGTFTLREGSYRIVATSGEMTSSTDVAVRSGNSRKVNLTLR
ncbi:hypothetical protein [Denitrobaculum tricleocarpae]|uniref:DUF4198 domain-containing protein n=1 Tax=Denitrobaculum tricleocarpae TaxID=2591009 RepID=A0A545TME7_9PROT|nr:hypothetical protein [Denitrobaculum tricleocarpae]TQV78415.1 hypothetical protein FKG95_17775 [Denitrobaculum tricleocarpae]